MKKVRFESPNKLYVFKMNDSECHSPRPFMERELHSGPPILVPDFPRVVTYSNDPIQRFESSNSSPYPVVNRINVPQKEPCWKPSEELNLSLLDASTHEPRLPGFCKSILKESVKNKNYDVNAANVSEGRPPLAPLVDSNKINEPPNVLVKDNSFFIKRDNLNKYNFSVNPIQAQLNTLNLGKENEPLARKTEMMKHGFDPMNVPVPTKSPTLLSPTMRHDCSCHHCIKNIECVNNHQHPSVLKERQVAYQQIKENSEQNCICSTPRNHMCFPCHSNITPLQKNVCKICSCHRPEVGSMPQNAVDRKTWAIDKYEQSKQPCMEVEKQKNISKDKREPTVADLFKIIKLQNEQLQLLQEKVDKFMSSRQNVQPTITCSTEHVAVNTVESNLGKMSVGVMTSFEMIRTSTVINKDVVAQGNNAQIQCNKSQISIKEVVSKPVNMNFLDGIIPKNVQQNNEPSNGKDRETENVCEEKTLNEQSLFNLQVDNATTPLISPEQTLYLDVRDYSDSDASSNDQSNVGWTYYNKVMTHVNGMLQDSEMPSSASAMYRNMRQQCVQMHIDTTNVSVTKRVKFGDDPLGLHQPHIYAAPSTDTSLKMNQLAAKYLKNAAVAPRPPPRSAPPPPPTIDMSFATRNYMEKHRLLQGLPAPSKSPQAGELPKFLDITALKQQPKFL